MSEQPQTIFLYKTLFRYHPETKPGAPELSVGTLQYTLPGLLSTMMVLCLGTGIFTIMQVMLGNALPLIARNYGANNQLIALLGTTIPQRPDSYKDRPPNAVSAFCGTIHGTRTRRHRLD